MSASRVAAILDTAPAVGSPSGVGLEEYYSEAGPDYAAWSPEFNMHFGFYRLGMNPFDRESMLEQMNLEVLDRLRIDPEQESRIVDLGCGLGTTLRSAVRKLPNARLTGVTRVPYQVEQARERNKGVPGGERITVMQMDYEHMLLPSASYDAAYALESSCHAHGADKAAFLHEAHRLLRPGGRLLLADAFLRGEMNAFQQSICDKLCQCWVIESWGKLDRVQEQLRQLGFRDIEIESCHLRVTPSVFHIPWVTLKFLAREVCWDKQPMTRARWNNVLAPILAPLVSLPLGPLEYCMVSATKA